MKKVLCVILSVVLVFSCGVCAFALTEKEAEAAADALKTLFVDGVGPVVNGVQVDYVTFSPAAADGEKLPLVIYFHGMGQGSAPRAQIAQNNIALWAGKEMQSRFTAGGAFLFVPRSNEDKGDFWPNSYIPAVKAAIDEFIAANADKIDLTRIYVGGFSMGGSMTVRMAESYPDFFAAAFPMCPAYASSEEEAELLADLPVWLTVSRFDVIAGWYTFSDKLWNNITNATNRPGDCRLSLLGKVTFPDGTKADSNHHVWFAVSDDMFKYDGSAYDNMTTVNGCGEAVELTYPDGMIAWLNQYTSEYAGTAIEANPLPAQTAKTTLSMAKNILIAIYKMFVATVKSALTNGAAC